VWYRATDTANRHSRQGGRKVRERRGREAATAGKQEEIREVKRQRVGRETGRERNRGQRPWAK